MTSAVRTVPEADYTELRHVLRSAVTLAVMQSAVVAAIAIVSRRVGGAAGLALEAVLLGLGVAVTIALPGLWTRARTIEGIAGAAGLGLAATAVFLVIDVALFQPLGLWSNRWLAIGGGSNWWYHPVWWMVGTYMPWMGAWVQANQAARSGAASPLTLVVSTLGLALVIMAAAASTGFPGAAFGVGTFGISVLPALALLVIITTLGARRSVR